MILKRTASRVRSCPLRPAFLVTRMIRDGRSEVTVVAEPARVLRNRRGYFALPCQGVSQFSAGEGYRREQAVLLQRIL